MGFKWTEKQDDDGIIMEFGLTNGKLTKKNVGLVGREFK